MCVWVDDVGSVAALRVAVGDGDGDLACDGAGIPRVERRSKEKEREAKKKERRRKRKSERGRKGGRSELKREGK